MKIYESVDHRQLIREWMQGHTYMKLAEATGMTSSFLSQVMNGDQEFSNDQVYAIGLYFQLDPEALDYVVLLNECQRCQLPERRNELQEAIEQIQDRHLRLVEYLAFDRVDMQSSPMDVYLGDPWAPIMDEHMKVEKNLKNPQRLGEKLGVNPDRLARTLEHLVKARIIEPEGKGYKRVVGETMVYKINAAAKFNAVYSRLKAVEKIFEEDPTDLVSTLIFCANEEFVQKVKARLLAFQSEALDHYQEPRPEEVYFINVDLFAMEGN
ncbi:MAG: DUF4423 domain-containing protein [Pseudobdellovibrionaceae bacterium]|nr:DUF4423 domain-containing protein [Pseudobdellovibrionaceae bacterium]